MVYCFEKNEIVKVYHDIYIGGRLISKGTKVKIVSRKRNGSFVGRIEPHGNLPIFFFREELRKINSDVP